MVHFFGIFDPGRFRRAAAAEAPAKARFFGAVREPTVPSGPMSRAEQDLCFLYGMGPEPDPDGRVEDFPSSQAFRGRGTP